MNSTASAPTSASRALTWCLHLLVIILIALAGARAVVQRQPPAGLLHAGLVVAVAAVCVLLYALGTMLPVVRRSRRVAVWWLAAFSAGWLMLIVVSADGVWVAFPLYLLHLHLLPRWPGLLAVAGTALASIVGFATHQGAMSAAIALGPLLGAGVAIAAVWGYQALYRESEQRRRLIEQLTATRADLAQAQHEAGMLAERERLAREIHDTLAQGLSSIQLLLRAAGRALPDRADTAAGYVEQARVAAVDNLAEARRFVAALTPPALEGATLPGALRRLCATATEHHRVTACFRLTGTPTSLPSGYEVALLRVAQSALANAGQHAHATTIEVTLGYRADRVGLTVVDDGIGFDPDRPATPGPQDEGPSTGGFGLAGMRARTRSLGGRLIVDSTLGRGTSIAADLPLTVSTTSSAALDCSRAVSGLPLVKAHP